MNWALFFSTFLLIFLAELGDKTQLAVMSQAASTNGKWTIFLAGALALVSTTAIGVLAGEWLRRLVPDERWIKWAGGILFIAFGLWMCLGTFFGKPRPADPSAAIIAGSVAATEVARDGNQERVTLTSWTDNRIVRQTEILERATIQAFEGLAKRAIVPEEKALYLRIVEEAKWHHEAMLCALATSPDRDIPFSPEMVQRLPSPKEVMEKTASYTGALERAIAWKRFMALYYQVLSESVPVRRLGDTFKALTVAEENLVRRRETLKGAG